MAYEYPQYFSTVLAQAVGTSLGTQLIAQTIGFASSYVRLLNTTAVDIYVHFKNTSDGGVTTADFKVRACSEVTLPNLPLFGAISMMSTSTTGAGILNVTALRSA